MLLIGRVTYLGLGCHERPHVLWYRLRDVWDSDLEDGADVLRAQPGGARQGDLHHQVESKAREEASLGQVCYGCGTVWYGVKLASCGTTRLGCEDEAGI